MNIIVGIGDMKVSRDHRATLITYGLGSCIGLTLYDPIHRVGGLLHFMLPDSQVGIEKSKSNPWMFADTGIPLFLKEIHRLGAERSRLIVKAAGGATIFDDSGFFNIGEKNYLMLRKVLWAHNLLIQGEDIGGQNTRTLFMELSTGRTFVKLSGNGIKEI